MFVGVAFFSLPGTADEGVWQPDHLEQHVPSSRATRRRDDRKGAFGNDRSPRERGRFIAAAAAASGVRR